MASYLIEFRFFGNAKSEMKRLIWEVNKKFHIRPKYRPVPHISLAGLFTTRNQRKLVSDFKKLCEKQNILNFNVEGFGTFEDNRVVFINIQPDKNLDEFRWALYKTLQPYCNLSQYDYNQKFEYHSTIAMKLNPKKFGLIKQYIKKKPKPNFKHILMRVTLLKNRKILYEYDFMLKKLLNRREAKNRQVLSKTFDQLHKLQGNTKITPLAEIEEIDLENVQESLLSKFFNKFRKRKIFFISDNHFDHNNIIRYCKRPFQSKSEMNQFMLDKWNNTVKRGDIVFFLGDMSYGKGSRPADYWLGKLKGNIFFIKGNHEVLARKAQVYDRVIIKYKDTKFFLVHSPANVPSTWKDWAICGHHHNNMPVEFPLINKKSKRINVSVELIDYTPISFEELLEKIK